MPMRNAPENGEKAGGEQRRCEARGIVPGQQPTQQLAAKGGGVVGINSFTLDGNKKEISEAKDILSKKGATYKNIWFDTNSEAGKFTSGLYSYPTTYVVDKNGNIVGQPIVGAITSPEQAAKLNKLIDTAIANSK